MSITNTFRLDGRTALVTGSGSGLGRAFADMLRAEGVEVWGTSRRPETLGAAERFHPEAFDLADGDAAEYRRDRDSCVVICGTCFWFLAGLSGFSPRSGGCIAVRITAGIH